MISMVGAGTVLVAVAGSGLLVWRGFGILRGSAKDARQRLRLPVWTILLAGIAAMLILELALLTDDFSVRYVAEHHSRSTPLLFTIATAWAALEGSIVLWCLVLAGYIYTVYRNLDSDDRPGAAALIVMGVVALFFFGMVATVANPFTAVSPVPLDGPGPNALLQNNILMAVHPPLLYLGYVGFTVPFAFALSALALGERGTGWLNRTHRWSLVAWTFLTAGIVAGAWWSYSVLGWGGYWAWDPVENASFLPWLVATAFIHSAIVQMRRGMLQAWNVVLLIATFALTILGTFLTRSGIVASVHSFTQSAVGPTLLAFLLFVVLGSLALFASRAHLVASAPRLDSFISREGSFLVNNLLLTLFAFVVLTGTLYPLLVEAFTGDQVSVGRPFFDRLATPISFALLLVMGLGPALPWRASSSEMLWRRLRGPIWAALAVGAAAVVTGLRATSIVSVLILSVFICSVIASLMWTRSKAVVEKFGSNRLQAIVRVARGDPAFWGGQIAHVGVAVVAVTIAVSGGLAERNTFTIPIGESVVFSGYVLEYEEPFTRSEPNREVLGGRVKVIQAGDTVGWLEPRFHVYPNRVDPVVTPSIRVTPVSDLYLTPVAISQDQIKVTAIYYPGISYLWAGGFLVAVGGAWALMMGRSRVKHRDDVFAHN